MTSIKVTIQGMECNACTASVARVVGALEGVQEVHVDLDDACARIRYDEARTTREQIHRAVQEAGFELGH